MSKSYILQYLHIYVFTFIDSKAVTLFEQMVSYYPGYKVGNEIDIFVTEELDVTNKTVEINTYIVKEIKDIIAIDKTEKNYPQHTLYIRVGEIPDGEEELSQDDSLTINYLLENISQN